MTAGHREDSDVFFDDEQMAVFVDDFHVTTLEYVVALALADRNLHALRQGVVKLCDYLAVDLYAPTFERGLDFGLALMQIGKQPFQQREGFLHDISLIIVGLSISIGLHSLQR